MCALCAQTTILHRVVAVEDIAHGVTIGDHVALEMPGAAESLLQEELTGASRFSVNRVVRAHDRSGVALDNGCRKENVVFGSASDV